MSQNSKFTTNSPILNLGVSEFCGKIVYLCCYHALCRNEHIPTPLDATSEPPPLFDGTTRFTFLPLFIVVFVFVRFTVFSMSLFRIIPCMLKSTWTIFVFVFKGCTSPFHAHLHNVCGSPGTIRLFLFLI